MKDKFILISGSASNSCPEAKLDRAIDFVRCFVGEVLRRGGGLVILASDDSATLDSSRLRKKGKALSRSVWSLNCLGGIRHVIGQFE